MILPAKHFYIIRHGETVANAARTLAGSLDTPLTDKGIAQAKQAATVIEKLPIQPQSVIHSHLSRARDTAEILNTSLKRPMFENPDLAEMDSGDWEGAPWGEIYSALIEEEQDTPNGETVTGFFERVRRGINHSLDHHAPPPLIVCHGGVMRAVGRLYGIKSFGFKNCHLYEFEPNPVNDAFPWRVWQYDQDEGTINRSQADLYHIF